MGVSMLLRWPGAGAWGPRVGNGLSLLVLLSMTVFVVRELRQCYRTACASVAGGEGRTSEATSNSGLSV
jgi:hypothetical protein